MKRFAAGLLVSAFAVSSAFGGTAGTVIFDHTTPDAPAGALQEFVITVETTAPGISGMDVLIQGAGTNPVGNTFGAGTSASWVFSPVFTGANGFNNHPFDFDLFGTGADLLFGASVPAGGLDSVGTSIEAGTLTIDTTGLPEGRYDYFVDANDQTNDFGLSATGFGTGGGVTFSPLFGAGSFNVVPEPATLGLLALGGLAVLRRRKSKKA